jgi:hypothetical protein
MTHRERRGGIEAPGKQFPGTVNERLAATGDDKLARAFQTPDEPAALLRIRFRGDEQALGALANHQAPWKNGKRHR